jgi:hypothetical protein
MTWRKRTIMEMARESGGMFSELPLMDAWVFSEKSLEAFAKLVREEALAQPEQEQANVEWAALIDENQRLSAELKFNTAPPQRKPLTDEEIKILWVQYRAALPRYLCFARAIEAAHGIKE